MTEKKPFIHLHNHTEYSLLDGAAQLQKLVQKAVEAGAPALGMTDHGNVYAAIQFYELCRAAGIKPVIGCEFYVTENRHRHEGRNTDEHNRNYHLVLIAKNYEGFRNLSRLTSISYLEGFHYKPRIDLEVLAQNSEHLICMSACIAGAIPRLLLRNDYAGAKAYAENLKAMFAPGDFYIEIQNHGIQEERIVNPLLVKLAGELGVKCVATNDLHYINQSDAEMHDALLCIQTASFIDEPNRMRFENDSFYYKSRKEMEQALGWCPEALDTPYEIAEKCDVQFTFNEYQLPRYDCPGGMPAPDYLRKITDEGLVRRYGEITPEIRARADSELEVIISMGFSEYYLIVWDFIKYAKDQDIPVGPGRGSGVGSIVAYAIAITNVDPLRYHLIFERFLNKNRVSMPDFDIDFCYNRRGEVIDYVKRKYGADHISQIITFGKMKTKAAIKDVARAYRVPFSEVSRMSKAIDAAIGGNSKAHISDLINPESPFAVPEIIESYRNDENYRKVLSIAAQIEGMPRNTSIHAAGVVIYKNPAIETIPLAKNGEEVTTQFNMGEVERLGLLKMDFLALMTLTDIKMAHDYVLKRTGIHVDFEKLGYNDPEVYALIAAGNTDAVFQLEGGGMKKFIMQFKPATLEDIIAGIALYRPGPMDNIPQFLENRRNPDRIYYPHAALKDILDVTNGIIIYQEQAMAITRALAGYDMTRADNFRAIISKKKVKLIPAEKQMFLYGLQDENGNYTVPGCAGMKVPIEVGELVFAQIEKFAEYAFNKSHAAAYAVLGYETAFYKRYYPVEFMAAVLNNRIGKPDDTKKYMQVLKDMGIPLLPPDINKSESFFSPDARSVRYGLACIKNVGLQAMDAILANRNEHGAFQDLYDFIERGMQAANLNKRAIESLIKGGALDTLGLNRASLLANYERVMQDIEKKKKRVDTDQYDIFSIIGEEETAFEYVRLPETPALTRFQEEKDMLGMYVSGHPLQGYEKDFASFNFNTSMLPKPRGEEETAEDGEENFTGADTVETTLTDGMDVFTGGILSDVTFKRTKDGKEMAILSLEDMYDKIELLAFARTMATKKQYMVKDTVVRIKGRLTLREDDIKITLNDIRPWTLSDRPETEETPPALQDGRTLYIHLTEATMEKLPRIDVILARHPGSAPVRLQYNGKIYAHRYQVEDLDVVADSLIGILGPHNVKIM